MPADTATDATDIAAAHGRLRGVLADMGSVVLGLSGGVDSSLLAKVAADTLGDGALAVIARSPSLPRRELATACEVADVIGIARRVVDTHELEDPRYAANPGNRCFYCKDELFEQLQRVAAERGGAWIAYGENVDDDGDHRPGRVAADQHGVRAPLREAGLTKAEVRELARLLELPVWDKPAFACLASRFPTGHEITAEKLEQVEAAEEVLWDLGLRQLRVRHHGDLARIEVEPDDLSAVVEHADEVVGALTGLGFDHVTLDLAGYRRGGGAPAGGGRRQLPVVG